MILLVLCILLAVLSFANPLLQIAGQGAYASGSVDPSAGDTLFEVASGMNWVAGKVRMFAFIMAVALIVRLWGRGRLGALIVAGSIALHGALVLVQVWFWRDISIGTQGQMSESDRSMMGILQAVTLADLILVSLGTLAGAVMVAWWVRGARRS